MYKLSNDDFNNIIKTFSKSEIDVIITDPPYGLTSNKEDIAVDLTPLFDLAKGLIIFTQQPYTSEVVTNHRKYFKYELIWDKVLTSGFLNANRQPLRKHENILVFGKPVYNPQKTVGQKNHSMGRMLKRTNNNYGHFVDVDNTETLGDLKHPTSIYTCPKPHPSVALHRTEKPVSLMEWLVATYSNIGDVVFDPFMGAGATGVACMKLGRWFYGCEMNMDYYNIAHERIRDEFYRQQEILHPHDKGIRACQERAQRSGTQDHPGGQYPRCGA
jgi:site-specific DNA-methyltransferase (adenine-specific)